MHRRLARAASLLVIASLASALGACSSDRPNNANADAATSDDASPSDSDDSGLPTNPYNCPDAALTPGSWFSDVTASAGITIKRSRAATIGGRFQGGACVFDVDGDGRLDIFLPGFDEPGASKPALYIAAHGTASALTFTEESSARGLGDTGQSTGCVAFDVDGDGDDDVLTVGMGSPRLWLNTAGNFTDASSKLPALGFPTGSFSTAAVAFDADGDGDLDLAISSYGAYVTTDPATCGIRDCRLAPESYAGGTTALLFQQADGSFSNESARLGKSLNEPGLVLLATDLDDDGLIDLFVGNDLDEHPDRYWKADGKGGFTEVGKAMGVAFNGSLEGVASMSAMDPDLDLDGHIDLLQSNFQYKIDDFYQCTGTAGCTDQSLEIGFDIPPDNLRWGQAPSDFDDDGIPEVLEAHGHLYDTAELQPIGDVLPPTLQPVTAPVLLWSRPRPCKRLTLVAPSDGLAVAVAGRDVVAADFDGDGALDAIVAVAEGTPLLLHNVRAGRGHHIDVDLKGKGKNTRAIGAKVTVKVGSRTWPSIVHAGSGFHGSGPARVHVGVGAATTIDSIEVRWPSGATTKRTAVAVDVPISISEP